MVSAITLVTWGMFSDFFMYHSSLFCFFYSLQILPVILHSCLRVYHSNCLLLPSNISNTKPWGEKKSIFRGPIRLQIQNRSCCKCFGSLFISEIAWGWGSCIYQTCSEMGHRSPELMLLIAPLPVHHQSSYVKKKRWESGSAQTWWMEIHLQLKHKCEVDSLSQWICTLNFLSFSTGL